MAGRSGGHHLVKGRWEEHGDGPSWLVDPEPRTPRHNLPDRLASKYPTLAELSAHIRRGTDCTHERLVDVMEQVLRDRPWVTLSA